MKKFLFLIILPTLFFVSCKKDSSTIDDTITVDMGTNSIYDTYYSFDKGQVKTIANTDWDIAFSVPVMTASIIISEGAGVQLWCVGDTNAWSKVNQSTINNLQPRYNDKSNWMNGAFNQNSVYPFNFGWGTYQMDTHNVIGDSIYIIKLTDGSYKKLFIREKNGSADTYVLRWANPDGSHQVDTSISPATYSATKNFIHYSILNKKLIEAEPDKDKWDLLFTNYIVKLQTGPTSFMDQPVVGVLANKDVKLLKVTGIAPENASLSDSTSGFSSQADLIGWDWKTYNQNTSQYSITADTSYFAKLAGGSIYKIYFTRYIGHATGTIEFKTKLVE